MYRVVYEYWGSSSGWRGIEEIAEAVQELWGYRPVIREDGKARAYWSHEHGRWVEEGHPLFNREEWLDNPSWVQVVEEEEEEEYA